MSYRLLLMLLVLASMAGQAFAQKSIRDKHITYQQERMVFKQWDRNKFTPTSGFLGLNPEYWITWFLHPDYPKTDLRPLGPYGPQTQRLGLVLAMQHTANSYKLHSDTLGSVARSELFNYSAAFSGVDPLWQLYYKFEFGPLLDPGPTGPFSGVSPEVMAYLQRSGLLSWHQEEIDVLRDRLLGAMNTNADRGSRIISYHRLLGDYRKLQAAWESKKQQAGQYLKLAESARQLRRRETLVRGDPGYRSDKQIAEKILRNSKF